jgi:RNA polymerase primary sigma factor
MNDTYFEQIGTAAALTDEQERALALRIENGDSRALNELVTANLRFVVYLAKQYQGKGLQIDDLISEGNIGLMKAAAKFHSNRNKRFVQHAAPYIRESIERALRQQTDTMSIDAPIPEGSQNTVSLLHVLENPDAPRADADIERRSLNKELQSSVGLLSPREQAVITRYYGLDTEPLSMAEIAVELGLKRERVRQIRDQAIRNLHRHSKS